MASEQMQLRSLIAFGQALERASSHAAVLATLTDAGRGMLPFGACALVNHTPSGWVVWRVPAGRPDSLTERRDIAPEAALVLDRFATLDQALRIDDLLRPPWNSTTHREVLWKDGTRSALLMPLIAAGQRQGTLVFTAFRPDVYTEVDLQFVGLVAWLVALALRAVSPSAQDAQPPQGSQDG